MKNKAYSVLQVKAFDEEKRVFTGIASTPTPDKAKDVLISTGAKFTLPMPLLFHHDHEKPIGKVISADVTKKGIEVQIELPEIEEEGALKERVDEAFQSLKYGLVNGLSVGFTADWKAVEQLEGGGFQFNEWNWHELSLVAVPCNNESYINQIKSISKSFEQPDETALGGQAPKPEEKKTTVSDVAENKPIELSDPNKGSIQLC
ncbi:TPA: HK97 family phage prohead protease [Acinetobacter baumannii]|nr:HK97 family phage prohead protease [Acinetobacter baumannii]